MPIIQAITAGSAKRPQTNGLIKYAEQMQSIIKKKNGLEQDVFTASEKIKNAYKKDPVGVGKELETEKLERALKTEIKNQAPKVVE